MPRSGPVGVHGSCPEGLLNRPPLLPTTQPWPVHAAVRGARPAVKLTLLRNESVQFAPPRSRKKTVPLPPPDASSRVSPAVMSLMIGAVVSPLRAPKGLHVPTPARFRTH